MQTLRTKPLSAAGDLYGDQWTALSVLEDQAAGGQDVTIIWWHANSLHAFIFQEKEMSEELDLHAFVEAITMRILLNQVWKRFGDWALDCNTKSNQRQSRERNYCLKR